MRFFFEVLCLHANPFVLNPPNRLEISQEASFELRFTHIEGVVNFEHGLREVPLGYVSKAVVGTQHRTFGENAVIRVMQGQGVHMKWFDRITGKFRSAA